MAADRAQHVAEVIGPRSTRGDDVVTDRYVGSSLAYQGYGRGLGRRGGARGCRRGRPAGLARPRRAARRAAAVASTRRRRVATRDRLRRRARRSTSECAAGFRELAAADPDRWVVVDGAGSVDEVAARVWAAVAPRLGRA